MEFKNRTLLLLILLFSLFTVRDLLRPGIYNSHDAEAHLVRIHQFHLALTDGQFPVRWAPTLLQGLGYPLFIVNYQLPLYFAEFFYLLGVGLFNAFKLTLLIAFLSSVFFSYLYFKKLWGEKAGLVGALLFTLTPWRFANIFTRGALGGTFVYAFIPLIMLAILKIREKQGITFFAFSLAMLLLAHAAVALVFTPAFLLVVLLHVKKDFRILMRLFLGSALAMLLAAFLWMPVVFERKYLKLDTVVENAFLGHFLPLAQVFRVPVEGVNIGTTLQLGITHTFLVGVSLVVALFFLIKKKKRVARTVFAYLLLFFFSIFMLSRYSRPLWENSGVVVKLIWLPWRFLGVAVFSVASLGAYLSTKIKLNKNLMVPILLLMLSYPYRHYFGPTEGWLDTQEKVYQENQETATSNREFDPIWFREEAFENLEPEIQITPQAVVTDFFKRPTSWRFKANLKQNSEVKLALLYFPGWRVTSNKKLVKINQKMGLINFFLPKGEQKVVVKFQETALRKGADILSLASFLAIFLLRKRFR